MDWLMTLWTALVIFGATVVHGIAGFGLAQISMGVLPLLRSPESASVVFSIVAVVSNARVWWSVRQDFRWQDWLIPVLGLAVGMPLGIFFFRQFDENQLRIAIGITLVVAVVLIAAFRQLDFMKEWLKSTGFRPNWLTGVLAGFLAGLLGGAGAIPGPPMILYGAFLMATGFWESGQMKAAVTAFFGTLMLYRVASLLVTGDVTGPLALEALLALPGMFLGAWLGIKIYKSIPRKVFGWIVLALLTANAGILLITSLPE